MDNKDIEQEKKITCETCDWFLNDVVYEPCSMCKNQIHKWKERTL